MATKYKFFTKIRKRFVSFVYSYFFVFRSQRGFSLIEMLVAIAIFSTTVVGIIGVMLTVMNFQRRISDIQAVIDNVRFSLELMTKELRTGTNYELTSTCTPPNSNSEITFAASSNESVRVYFFESNPASPNFGLIMRFAGASPITSTDCDGLTEAIDNGLEALPFTSEEVNVTHLNFQIVGGATGPQDGQPFITISLGVQGKNPKILQQTSMNIQTSVMQRLRDQIP